MQGYYKLNTNGTIQSRSKQVDNTWLPLSGLETKETGEYYTYYNQDGTPDLVKEEAEAKAILAQQQEIEKQEALDKLTVTISTGKEFYVDPISRGDISDAIKLSEILGNTETEWKLASEYNGSKITIVTLNELQEALMLGLQAKASLIGVE